MCAEWCGRDGDGVVYPGIERPEINCYSDVREDSIIVVSRMVKSKSLETVLDIAMASNSRPKVIFVGNGPEKATLMKVAGSLPLDVEFMGEVDDKTKWSELSKAKVFLFTSRFEGFGMPPGEALAVGTPCICRDLPILHEVYGESVEYFNTVDDGAQKLDRLLSDYDYWMTMSERGREYIDGRYTWGKAAEMINHVLEQNMLRCDGSQ
jgi:glycosyltransferase involved in cell wall biosynthesis